MLLLFYGLLKDNLQPNKFGGDLALTSNILAEEIGNHLCPFFSKSECQLHENAVHQSEFLRKTRNVYSILLVTYINYIPPNLNFLRIKILNIPNTVLQFYFFARVIQIVHKLCRCEDLINMRIIFLYNMRKSFVRQLQTFK